MTPRFNFWLALILALFVVPHYWLFYDNRPGDPVAKPVSIAQLRKLAAEKPGDPPAAIEFDAVASKIHFRNFSAAGRGMRPESIYAIAYRLDFPGEAPILIGSGVTRKAARDSDMQGFDARAFRRVAGAMKRASHVILLGPGASQTGGLAVLSDDDGPTRPEIVKPPKSGRDEAPRAVAPGVVVIPTGSVRPGTQLAYVRLSNGHEFVFAGPLSPTRYNVRDLRAPSRWVTDLRDRADRKETYAWLATIRSWQDQAPGLVVVPGRELPKSRNLVEAFKTDE